MISFKCKMCGGDLSFEQGSTIAECPYCGTTQTLPKLDDDKRANLYDRANHFRRQNDYDKATAIYEQILAEDRTDAEAYWSLVLCRYGIEYVEDPASHKRVPTVNRVQYASILADEDYKSALQYADTQQRSVYEAEANAIAEIQRGILDISRKEAPFDVFICYKETDANGRRTPDSVLANDMYHQLTKEGFKVFFSRITLEDKIGTAYEPYIFAALNSAKVMVVLGTKPEYFNAVWVKNEWSRYLALIRNGADKTLVPAYRDMDPYDLPDEFAHLQAQDMGKLGFMQDLIRGIKKILHKDEPKAQPVAQQPTTVVPAGNVAPLLKRAFMFLEDGDFARADDFCEQVLNLDPENGRAYLGKLMAELKVRREGDLKNQSQPFDVNGNYQKAMRFGDEALKAKLKGDIDFINNRNEHARQKGIYDKATKTLRNADTVEQCQYAKVSFQSIPDYEGVGKKLEECDAKAEAINDSNYRRAMDLERTQKWQEAIGAYEYLGDYRDCPSRAKACWEGLRTDAYNAAERLRDESQWGKAISAFERLGVYRDSKQQAERCRESQEAERQAEEQRREQERVIAERKTKEEVAKKAKIAIIVIAVVAVAFAAVLLYNNVIKPNSIYSSAVSAMTTGNYDEATAIFESLGNYKDAATQAQESQYQKGVSLMVSERYDEATDTFLAMNHLEWDRGSNLLSNKAIEAVEGATYALEEAADTAVEVAEMAEEAAEAVEEVAEMAEEAAEAVAEPVDEASDKAKLSLYDQIITFDQSGYKDSLNMAVEAQYQKGLTLLTSRDYDGATTTFNAISGYNDAATQAQESQYQKGVALLAIGDYDGATAAFVGIRSYNDAATQAQESQYQKGTALLTNEDYDGASAAFNGVSDYKDAAVQAQESQYQKGTELINTNRLYEALHAFRIVGKGYKDIDSQLSFLEEIVSGNAAKISTGNHHTVGLKTDGTIVAIGGNDDGQCNIDDWCDIVLISAGESHTVGLKNDGTVVATGRNNDLRCNVEEWRDIVSVSAGYVHTIGLKSDGSVTSAGENSDHQCEINDWSNISAVTAGKYHTVGLKDDGTVIATGRNNDGRCNVNDWHDIVAVSAGYSHTVGLKADGTVVAVGSNKNGQCDVDNWCDIIAVSAGESHTIGLKVDGTVIATGNNSYGQCDVGDWSDIIAVSNHVYHTVGLKADGTVIATGRNNEEQCKVGDWKLLE